MDIRSLQRPLKDLYRQLPASSRITLTAHGTQTDAPIACSVDLGREIYKAQAHKGVGGAGTGACSGDLLLGALAACAQITCQMVAAAMEYLQRALMSRSRAIWICKERWEYRKRHPSDFRASESFSTSAHRMQLWSN